MHPTERAIYELAKQEPYIDKRMAAHRIFISHSRAAHILRDLMDRGFLTRVQNGHSFRYSVPKTYCPHCGQVIR